MSAAVSARILVVEDELIVARDIQQQLLGLGYAVAGHTIYGEKVTELVGRLKPDLVIMDIHLAGDMDGVSAAQAVREQFGIPVVFLTAFSADAVLERAKLTQPYGYMLKPFSERELRTLLEMALYKHQSERALRESQQHTLDILNSVEEAVVTINAEGIIQSANQSACATFGWCMKDLIGRDVADLVPSLVRESHDRYLSWYGETRQAHAIGLPREMNGMRKDGSVFPLTMTISRIQRGGEDVFVGSIRDISQTRHYVQELERHQKHLEELVRARTGELHAALQRAGAASAAKSVFVANVSHEIRTPMNAILGFAHLMQKDEDRPAQLDRLAKIQVAGRHLLSVINDVLDFSKIEAGQLVLETANFQLQALLENVMSLMGAAAQAKDLHLSLEAAAEPVWLCGDETRLRQALINYVANAIKFTPVGCISVRAGVEPAGEGMLWLRLEVQDSGIGIEPEAQGRIFSAFEQANAMSDREQGGTGLGLAITRRLAVLMGGDAGFQSTPGQGSVFWLTARVYPGQPVRSEPASSNADPSLCMLRARPSRARVLVVDDDPFNREIACDLLVDARLQVQMAPDGAGAVALAQEGGFDLVLMDVQMPVMDGLTACRLIRALPGWADRPILALTANAFEQDRIACLAAGMNDFVPKPIEPERMYAAVLQWLDAAKGSDDESI